MVAYIVSPRGECPSKGLVDSVASSVSKRLSADSGGTPVRVKFAPYSSRSFARTLKDKHEAVLVAGSPLKATALNFLPVSNGELDRVVGMLKESEKNEDSFSIIAPYLEDRVHQ